MRFKLIQQVFIRASLTVIVFIGVTSIASASELFTASWESDADRVIMGERVVADARGNSHNPMPVSVFCDTASIGAVFGMADDAEAAIYGELLAGTTTHRMADAVHILGTVRLITGIGPRCAEGYALRLVRFRVTPLGIPAESAMRDTSRTRYTLFGFPAAMTLTVSSGTSPHQGARRHQHAFKDNAPPSISPEYSYRRNIVDRFRLYLYLWEDHPCPSTTDISLFGPLFEAYPHSFYHTRFSYNPFKEVTTDTTPWQYAVKSAQLSRRGKENLSSTAPHAPRRGTGPCQLIVHVDSTFDPHIGDFPPSEVRS